MTLELQERSKVYYSNTTKYDIGTTLALLPGAAVPFKAVGVLSTPIVLSPTCRVKEVMMNGVGPILQVIGEVDPSKIRSVAKLSVTDILRIAYIILRSN